ncbi:precorrin-8X methylmutase [Granulicella sp. dw_53]|uniref:precorrin-8X methylmutase n=1 Tax=Granulicella sp. dw_53 TaxID=2719792 RepID=UPI001BD69D73|nr:precorrin-8X methylmutase [Granulicella sp. dw_53]
MKTSYKKDAAEIYRESFAIIRAEADLSSFPPELARVVVRMIHACGMTDLTQYVSASSGAAEAGIRALREGAPILCDAGMVANGVTRSRLPAENEVICTLRDSQTAELAAKLQTTRSAAALELWRDKMGGSVVAIGNAPTALFHLLDMVEEGAPRPALIIGVPVGFVGAAESKAALEASGLNLPYLTIQGRRGGSAIAAAAVNALASEEE